MVLFEGPEMKVHPGLNLIQYQERKVPTQE